jgi:hypothetical protein
MLTNVSGCCQLGARDKGEEIRAVVCNRPIRLSWSGGISRSGDAERNRFVPSLAQQALLRAVVDENLWAFCFRVFIIE